MVRLVPFISVVLAAIFVIACDPGAATVLTPDERRQLEEVLRDVQGEISFSPRLPGYIPAGLKAVPEATNEGDRHIILLYWPRSRPTPPSDPYPLLLMIQETWDPDQRSCPPCSDWSDPDFQPITIDGIEGVSREFHSGERRMAKDIYFRSAELLIIVSVTWEFPESVTEAIGDDMRKEALRIAESMLD